MTRLTAALMILLPLMAQAPVPPAQQPAVTPPVADQKVATPEPAKVEAPPPPPSPAPTMDNWLTGSIDLGYRWRSQVDGSVDTYRSIVNLGSGPKLLGAEFTLTDPKHRAFDLIRVRAYNFGGDPYQTFHLDARKSKLYDFSADYRDIAYFNALPSFADPLLARGVVLNEQSFDTHRRFASFQLDLLPGNWFVPFFAFDRDSGSGAGATVFVTDGNEFPVPSALRDVTNLYRGGVRFAMRRFHVTLEQGGTTFNDHQSLFQNAGFTNPGNLIAPVFGQKTDLTSLLATYGAGGSSIYSKALFTASATSYLDLYGQFLYSQPETNVTYQQADTGNFLLQTQLLFYTGQQYLVSATAKLPHTSASFGAEIRPAAHLRIVQSWMTDRLHNAGSAMTNQALTGASGVSQQTAALLASSLVTNYSQEEIEALYDLTPRLMIRGGYRYVWGNAADAVLPPEGLVSSDRATLRRNVGLGGVTFRPNGRISLTGDVEVGSSGGSYFRTSLYNYQKVRAQARYQALTSLAISADFSFLNNQNPTPGVSYDYRAQQQSLAVFWAPSNGKLFDLQGSYTRSTLRSDIGYLAPQTLSPLTSLYRDNAHTATVLVNVKLPRISALAPKLTAGGSFFISSGSRPSNYYQPLATLVVPVLKHVNWFTEWRYYGYREAFYLYEDFHTRLITTGLRFTR